MYRLIALIPIFMICLAVSAQDTLPRNPTVDQVAAYLRSHLDEPPSGFISYFWVDDESLIYADLNGDGEDDLISRGWLFVAIMLWQGDSYSDPLQVIYTASPESGAWSHVELQDWTLDDVLDITFDRRVPINEAGFEGNRYQRTLISCELLCYVAWEGEIAEYIAVESEQGMVLSQAEMIVYENDVERTVLDVITRDFAFNCVHAACVVTGEVIEQDSFQSRSRIGAIIRTRYLWDGLEFLRSESITLIDASIMPSQSRLSATHDDLSANITYEDMCQLWLDEIAIGEVFPCVVDFTRIYWHDDSLVLEYSYFTEETIVMYDSLGVEQFQASAAIRDFSLFGLRLDDNKVLSAGTRYSDDCPQQQCWFTLNQQEMTIDLPE